MTSVTVGFPDVRVPVLSMTIVETDVNRSRLPAFRIRIPWVAATPTPTVIAVGVASPSAHGQAIMRTAMKLTSECVNVASATNNQPANVRRASAMTEGTKTDAILSARFWIGAFDPWASSTSFTICARTVCSPTAVARSVTLPFLLTVPPTRRSPLDFSIGRLSPVTIDSSTVVDPEATSPSTGIRSPGRITTMSPAMTPATGISVSFPSRITRAVEGWRAMRFRMASDARRRARASRYLPVRIRVMIVAAVSK